MRIFVLGGGYIGLMLLKQWKNSSDIFWVSTTTAEKLPKLAERSEKAFLLQGDDEELLKDVTNQCDGIVVCVAPGRDQDYKKTYLRTAQALMKSIASRTKPLYILYTSSTSVYGDHQGRVVKEDAPCLALSDKARLLCETENTYLSCKNAAVSVCVLRLAGIYGPGREIETRAKALSGKTMPGRGDSTTNHIHSNDVVRAIEFCFKNQCTGIYNLANSDHRPRQQIYDEICNKLSLPSPKWDGTAISDHGSNCTVSSQKILDAGFSFAFPAL